MKKVYSRIVGVVARAKIYAVDVTDVHSSTASRFSYVHEGERLKDFGTKNGLQNLERPNTENTSLRQVFVKYKTRQNG